MADMTLDELNAEFRRIVGAIEKPGPALTSVGNIIVGEIVSGFDREQDPFGSPWEPLKPSTQARKGRGGTSSKILQDTGRLKSSFTFNVDGDNVEIGTNVIYAPPHQFGYALRGIPARPMMDLTGAAYINTALDIIIDHLND